MAGGHLAGTGLTGVLEPAKALRGSSSGRVHQHAGLCTACPHGTAERGLRKEQQRRRG